MSERLNAKEITEEVEKEVCKLIERLKDSGAAKSITDIHITPWMVTYKYFGEDMETKRIDNFEYFFIGDEVKVTKSREESKILNNNGSNKEAEGDKND